MSEEERIRAGGHINESRLVTEDGVLYVEQRVNGALFSQRMDALEANYRALRKAFEKLKPKGFTIPLWEEWPEGCFHRRCADGSFLRRYPYIPGESPQLPYTAETLRAFGAGLACLHHILAQAAEIQEAVLPTLHDAEHYLSEYQKLTQPKNPRVPKLEEQIEACRESMMYRPPLKMGVIHGDARIANALFNEGCMIAMVDLDTLMPGPRLLDIADALRSVSGKTKLPAADAQEEFLRGYNGAGYDALSEEELRSLPAMSAKLRHTLGLRYYSDYLAGCIYFKKNTPEENLKRAAENLEIVL